MIKIYTKTGDKGETGLFGNKRVTKNNSRIEAYGTIDELNSAIGVAHAEISEEKIRKRLERVQGTLFIIGAELATPKDTQLQTPHITQPQTTQLEKEIDAWNAKLPRLQNFILPGGNKASANVHLCRSICRRAERRIVSLQQTEIINQEILIYINRLSDWLFVLARKINAESQGKEHTWK